MTGRIEKKDKDKDTHREWRRGKKMQRMVQKTDPTTYVERQRMHSIKTETKAQKDVRRDE
jgi:hypothetical protein